MLARADRRMSVAAFLEWDDGTDRRWQLIDGVPCMMAPARHGHRLIAGRLFRIIADALEPPCEAEMAAGIRLPHRSDAYYVADLAVSCTPYPRDQAWIADPVLIVEVLSASTEAQDRRVKLPDYQRLPSVQEIVFLSAEAPRAETWRRDAAGRFAGPEVVTDGVLTLRSVGTAVERAALWR